MNLKVELSFLFDFDGQGLRVQESFTCPVCNHTTSFFRAEDGENGTQISCGWCGTEYTIAPQLLIEVEPTGKTLEEAIAHWKGKKQYLSEALKGRSEDEV